jgi:26S proteasome regulatory subunit N4
MTLIEKHLHEHFASLEDSEDDLIPAQSGPAEQLRDVHPQDLSQPFAKVNSVVSGSPAEVAGLQAGDLLRTFGYVDASNHDNLKKVGECVQSNEGVSTEYVPTEESLNLWLTMA